MPRENQKEKRKRSGEALLADRLGLNEDWIERWEDHGEWHQESFAPDQLPAFITEMFEPKELKEVKREIGRLVEAGCRKHVIYFCLAQLSPDAEFQRSGGERESVPSAISGGDESLRKRKRRLATSEDLEAVANTARAARRQIHRFQRELLLAANATGCPLPMGFGAQPEDPADRVALVKNLLTWVTKLAEA